MDPLQAEIGRLREELYSAREALIRMLPESVQAILKSYAECISRDDRFAWESRTIMHIVELARPVDNGWRMRTACPLCQAASVPSFSDMPAYPVGLERHLTAWGDRRRCEVMAAAHGLAREYWKTRYAASDREEDERKEAQQLARRSTEELYQLAPDHSPVLIDEGSTGKPRTSDGVAWAEARVRELGLAVTRTGNVLALTDELSGWRVYADPRSRWSIRFLVYEVRTSPKGKEQVRYANQFSLLDSARNDLKRRYETRLRAITGDARRPSTKQSPDRDEGSQRV